MRKIRNHFAHPIEEETHLDTNEVLDLLKKFPDYNDWNGKMVRVAYWQLKYGECRNYLAKLVRGPSPEKSA
jgi:hypothetical protein